MPKVNEAGQWRNKEGIYVHKDMVTIDKQLEDEVVDENSLICLIKEK